MKTICLLFVYLLFLSCSTPQYRICEYQTSDIELKLYHDILTELIEHRFYNRYLQPVSGDLEKYPPSLDFSDTPSFKKDLILAQNKLFKDTAKFETICYKTILDFGPWNPFQTDSLDFFKRIRSDTTQYWRDLKTLLTSFSPDWESIADTIAKPQTKYTGDSFKLCTSKVVSCEHFYDSDIGVVGFSKVFMNSDKTKGLLYYEYKCGGKCGMGGIILVEIVNHLWRIREVSQLWIS